MLLLPLHQYVGTLNRSPNYIFSSKSQQPADFHLTLLISRNNTIIYVSSWSRDPIILLPRMRDWRCFTVTRPVTRVNYSPLKLPHTVVTATLCCLQSGHVISILLPGWLVWGTWAPFKLVIGRFVARGRDGSTRLGGNLWSGLQTSNRMPQSGNVS